MVLERQLVVRVQTSMFGAIQVECDILQCLVLGSCLSPLFINDPARVRVFNFFTDEVKIWRMIKGMDNHQFLQRDLDATWYWSVRNTLPFNVDNCHLSTSAIDTPKAASLGCGICRQILNNFAVVRQCRVNSVDPNSNRTHRKEETRMLICCRRPSSFDVSIFSLLLNPVVRPQV